MVVRVRVSAFIHCFDYWKKRKIWLTPLNWLTYVGFSSTRAEAFLLSGRLLDIWPLVPSRISPRSLPG